MNIILPHRPRRNRKHPAIRAMVREHHVGPEHLVYPLFIHAGDVDVPIGAMPGCSRLSPAGLMREVEAARAVGVHSFALFPAVAEGLKTPDGREAHNADGLIPRTMKALKDRWPDVVLVGFGPGELGKLRLTLKGTTVDVLATSDEEQRFAAGDSALVIQMNETTAVVAREPGRADA